MELFPVSRVAPVGIMRPGRDEFLQRVDGARGEGVVVDVDQH